MGRWPLVVFTLLVVMIGGRYIYGIATRMDDKTQIQQALAEAVKASKEGRPGSVVDKLSDQFKLNGQGPAVSQVADFIKNNHPEVVIKDTEPLISGDTAQITSDVTVKVSFLGDHALEFKDVLILFRKESATDWLIFPTSKWRLYEVKVSANQLPEIPSIGLG